VSTVTGSPADLLRLPDAVEPYPAERSDEQLAEELGLPLDQVIRFDMNTLGGGPLPAVVEALRTYDPARLVEYGDQAYRRLRGAIESATGAPAQRIIPGAGADELIRLVTGMVVGADDAVVIPTPTFAMFAVEARLAGARVVEVARDAPSERQPVDRIRAVAERSAARLVWLCSPNNPTGDRYDHDEIERLASGLGALVVVDAVYQEIAEVEAGAAPEAYSLLPLQARLPNLVILRSLSKAYGLAGARVGYLVVPEALAARFEASRLPLAIGGASEAAAIAALSDVGAARARLAEIVKERERVMAGLLRLGWDVAESHANFLLVHPPDAQGVAADLLRRGLAVRSYPAGLLRPWLRFTIRSPFENDRLLEALGATG
jgi:histidinol-phosphate aminotransferase